MISAFSLINSKAQSRAILLPPSFAEGAITTPQFSITFIAFKVKSSLLPGPTPIPYNFAMIIQHLSFYSSFEQYTINTGLFAIIIILLPLALLTEI